MNTYCFCLHLLQHVACVLCNNLLLFQHVFVIKGDTVAWRTTSASPSPHQFLPSQQTASVSWFQPDRHAFAALKQRRTPPEHSPQRDTLVEAPWNGTVTHCQITPITHTKKKQFLLYTFCPREIVQMKTVDSNICELSWATGSFFYNIAVVFQRSVFEALSTTTEILVTTL